MIIPLEQRIREFEEHYANEVVRGLKSFSNEDIDDVAKLIQNALDTQRNTIYIFGNGGSNAIARHFDLSLKDTFRGKGYGIRTNTGVAFDLSQQLALECGYEQIFRQTLEDEQANSDDLVIFISGSGNSSNLIETARYCNTNNIPNISFSGFDGGEISRTAEKSLVARINDQQIAEDVIQSLLHLCVARDGDYIPKLRSGLERISSGFLDAVTEDIANAYLEGRNVYVLAPEGNGLSISAEHTAHNLNWDAVYGIENPPARNIHSTPTNCDYSGIANDRVADGIVTIQQLEKAKAGDVLVLYAQDVERKSVKNVIDYAREKGVKTYIVSGIGNADVVFDTDNQFVTADLMQMTGHMIGRITNFKLKYDLGYEIGERDLIENDLAQRRLIGEKHGL